MSNYYRIILKNPLSLLRFLLSFLIGRSLVQELKLIQGFSNNYPYELSQTWITNLVQESLFIYGLDNFVLLKYLILVFTLGSMLGILGRINLLLLSIMSFLLVGVEEGLGAFNHHLSLSTQVLFILVFVPGSLKISLDYLFYKKFLKKRIKINKETPNWGFNLILLLLMLTYLSAGISKVRYGTFKWFDGSTLGFYMEDRTFEYSDGNKQLIIGSDNEQVKWKDKFGFHGHTYGNYQSSKLARSISSYIVSKKYFLVFLSIATVLFEIIGFMMFVNTKYRNIYLFSAILMHTSIGFLMGLTFTHYRLICLCLIDWTFLNSKINMLENYISRKKKSTLKNRKLL